MVVESKLYVLIEDAFGNKIWKQTTSINLGSVMNPNKEVLGVKIISI